MTQTSHRVSFVVPARNEDPAVVAATVAGILATTPEGWREILVIDDASATPVDVTGPGVTVVRNPEPVGVSRARRQGAAAAAGSVIVWLDAHMSFGAGWLDALLAHVDSGALLCPPWRDYARARPHCWGSDFGWNSVRDRTRALAPGFVLAVRRHAPRGSAPEVPMVIGGCYAMRRDAYQRLGGCSPLFRVYGSDEQDLSARVWLSGGSVRCVPAAEVGHLDRPRHPYEVSWSHVEFNQLVLVRTVFERETAAVLEEFLHPLPEDVARWAGETDIAGWRSEVQGRRRISDAAFFHRRAPRIPLTFAGSRVRLRRGHVPLGRRWAALVAEEQALARRLPRAPAHAAPAAEPGEPAPDGTLGGAPRLLTGVAHGVRLAVEVEDEAWLGPVAGRLPGGWTPAPPGPVDLTCALRREPAGASGALAVLSAGRRLVTTTSLATALGELEQALDRGVATLAPEGLFIRAAVVAGRDRAIIMPGTELSGRRALALALVEAGARYYSDTYAVLDAGGRVRPYPRPPRLHGIDGGPGVEVPVLGSAPGPAEAALLPGLIAVVDLVPGGSTRLRSLTAGQALRALVEHVVVRGEPAPVIRRLARLAAGTPAVGAHRGPARPVARALLARLDTPGGRSLESRGAKPAGGGPERGQRRTGS